MTPAHERDTLIGIVIGLVVVAGVALATGSSESLPGVLRFAVGILVFVAACRGIAWFRVGAGSTETR